VGGIASVIQTILDSALRDTYEFSVMSMSEVRHTARNPLSRVLNSALARGFGFDGVVSLESRGKLAAFRSALERERPDLVHLHSSHGYDFWLSAWMAREARRRGVRSLLHVHGLFDVVVPRYSALRRAVFARALRAPDRMIVLSEGWKRWFSDWCPPERLAVVRNCVDLRRFPAPRFGRERSGTRVLFVGTQEPQRKGGYDILRAAPDVIRAEPGVRFVFVGADLEDLEARFVRGTPLAPHFEFAGNQSAAEIAPYFADADLLLLPSYSEGLPIALLEAMAAGLPVVACPVNGVPEAMAEPENGIFVAPGDAAALARAIVELARDPARRERIGRANRARAELEFDRTHFADRLGEVYASVLAETRTA
jgi:glycosyltransferase involved in cell wall biosynthesis